MGSDEALKFVDDEAVRELECRSPGASTQDDKHISWTIRNNLVLRRLTQSRERQLVLRNLRVIEYLIPSLHTLQQDFKYLSQCTRVMRKLISNSFMFPTVRAMAMQAFTAASGIRFLGNLKELYLHIMRNLVELSGENPLLEEDEVKLKPRHYNPAAWFRLAVRARDLDFASDEITRLCQQDPDKESARSAILHARPPNEFEYGSDLDMLVETVAEVFKKARPIQSTGLDAALTTSSLGEPLARRCGRQYSRAYAQDRHFLTSAQFTCKIEKNTDITSLFVRRSVFGAFWGFDGLSKDTSWDDSMSDATETSPKQHDPGPYDMRDAFKPTSDHIDANLEQDTAMNDAAVLPQDAQNFQAGKMRTKGRKRQKKAPKPVRGHMAVKRKTNYNSARRSTNRSSYRMALLPLVSQPATGPTNPRSESAIPDVWPQLPPAFPIEQPNSTSEHVDAVPSAENQLVRQKSSIDKIDVWLLQRNNEWKDIGSFIRADVRKWVDRVMSEAAEGEECFLFNNASRGISLHSCCDMPTDDAICITSNKDGFKIGPPGEIL